jgi:uncharacterized membrane protein YccC
VAGVAEAAGAKRILDWFRRRGAELRLSLRMTMAGLVAYALAEAFSLAQGYWAVLTAVIVVQASLGGSLQAVIDRLVGTLGGAAFGAAIALLVPHAGTPMTAVALILALAPLALFAAIYPGFRMAPVTAVIVLLGSSSAQAGPLEAAEARVIEIGLGCIVGLGASLLVFPARAHGLLAQAAGRVLDLLADLLTAVVAAATGSGERSAIQPLSDRLRDTLTRLEAVGKEAERERRSRLSDEPDPEPLMRTLRRLRSDLVIIARAAAEPFPAPVRTPLAAPLARVAEGVGEFFRRIGAALIARSEPPALGDVLAALDNYAAALAELRRAGITRDLPGEEAGRIFAFGFALEQLRSDLVDLLNRAREFAGAAREPSERRDPPQG